MTKKIVLIGVFCFSQFFIQCNSDDHNGIVETIVTEQNSEEIIRLRNFLSKSLHMDINKIIYDSGKSAFIIDGDVLMPLEDAIDRFDYLNSQNTNKTNQRLYSDKMSLEMAASITVFVSPEVSAEWRIALNQAINHWNNINSSINITIVNTSTPSTINVTVIKEGSGNLAYGSYPNYTGVPGRSIQINSYYNNAKAYEKLCTMAHELGHTFGLSHTNQTEGYLIACTPLSDWNSVMQIPVHEWTGFNYYDNIAISTLYPVAVGTKKLYRFKKQQYYYYTTDACEIVPGNDGYIFDGDAGYLYSTQISGTIPLYRSLNGGNVKDHRLSKVKILATDIIVGYLYSTKQLGTTGVYSTVSSYEYFPVNYSHYLYSTNFNKDAIMSPILGYVPNKVF